MDDRAHFCQPCDVRHEGEALWDSWSGKNLHQGVQEWRVMTRIAGQLHHRLCRMLAFELGHDDARRFTFEEAVCWAGEDARAVLERLRRYEAKYGRREGRPKIWADDRARKRDWKRKRDASRRNSGAVGDK